MEDTDKIKATEPNKNDSLYAATDGNKSQLSIKQSEEKPLLNQT